MIENENIQNAKKELEYLTGDEEVRRLAELREKAIRDEQAALKKARREGKEEGREEGKKIQNEMIKNLLKNKVSIDIIAKSTGLTKEEIEKLK